MNAADLKTWAHRNAEQNPFISPDGEAGGADGTTPAEGDAPPVVVSGEEFMTLAGDMTELADRVEALAKADTESEVDLGKLAATVDVLREHAEIVSTLADELLAEEATTESLSDDDADGGAAA